MNLKHPQYAKDRQLLDSLLPLATQRPIPELVLAEVARLCIRYQGFPGAEDIQKDLDQTLENWQMSESDLFAQSRLIHQRLEVYPESFSNRDDWA